ncbi:MAG: SUMF1/EgtB/PvdO family nonheme iron enzyme [Polyangiaceae bacterium]|nr:SUMF1/EgtB/PvdO family nonheme iron enzyme [Polyangiaceae bacterium]
MRPSLLPRTPSFWIVAAAGLLILGLPSPRGAAAKPKGCPKGMAPVQGRYCIDRYEASTVEILGKGKTRPHSPYLPVDGLKVKAVSKGGVKPQAYISRDQAEEACKNAGKRLCTDEEWVTACKGKRPTTFPYGDDRKAGACNDAGVSSFNHYYGDGGAEPPQAQYTWDNMNDSRLNQMKGTLAPTGRFKKCKSSYGTYDMVGNLHEWTSAPGGTFRGGYYLDTALNGDGCEYKTTAHVASYHDYSTGFRCCK